MDKNNIGGYVPGEIKPKWPIGTLFASEGERLYDLVREHKPKKIIEVGCRYGCSTIHLATACLHNGFGVVHTYDIENIHFPWPEELKKHIKFNHHNYFDLNNKVCDLLFEDGAHTTGFTRRVLKETTAKVVAVHDYLHWDCQDTVKDEAYGVLAKPTEVFIKEESDCGLAIWVL